MESKLRILFCLLFFSFLVFSGCTASKHMEVMSIDCPNEVFPVYCVLGSKILPEGDGLFYWKIKNKGGKEETIKVTSEVSEFTTQAVDTITLKPGETREFSQFPVFNDKVLELTEQKQVSAKFTLLDDNKILFEETKEFTLLATDDMTWGVDNDIETSYLIAAWVTPRDPVIGKIISMAKEKVSDRSFCGYQRETKEEFMEEIEAIWNTLQEIGISYVSSSVTFADGYSQRVRLPRESITEKSANCVDGCVLLASVFENLEMEPVIVMTTEHAFLGVRAESESEKIYYIETTMLGDSTLKEAIEDGTASFKELKNLKEGKDYVIVDILQERANGITPLPVKGEEPEI